MGKKESVGTVYSYGLKVGMELLAHGRFTPAAKHLIIPVSYWRTVEFRLVLTHGQFKPGERVLDIGSPKLISLYLAKHAGVDVYATDIDRYFVDEYDSLRKWERLPDDRYHVDVQDGRKLTYQSGMFDKVFSISVLEHIPEDGDSECMREIGRVLAPGGRCLITVPFARVSQDQYRPAGDFYWSTSSQTNDNGKVFFQRRYSEADLVDRLIIPSGLKLVQSRFVGERLFGKSDRELFEHLPPVTHPLLGPFQPVLSSIFHTPPVANTSELQKPLCAFLELVKLTD